MDWFDRLPKIQNRNSKINLTSAFLAINGDRLLVALQSVRALI